MFGYGHKISYKKENGEGGLIMLITNRSYVPETYVNKKDGKKYLEYKFAYKDSPVSKEKYKKGKFNEDKERFTNNKAGMRLAEEARAKHIEEFDKNYIYEVDSDMRDITFLQFKDVFYKHFFRLNQENIPTANTKCTYNVTYNNFKELNDIKMRDITVNNIAKIVYELNTTVRSSSLKIYIAKLIVIFKYAASGLEIIKPINLKKIDLMKDSTKKEKVALTIEQSELILEKNKNESLWLLIYLCIKLGLRVGEALGLTEDKIDYENGLITINQQYVKVENEDKDGFHDELSSTLKTGNSYRIIPVKKEYMNVIKKTIAANKLKAIAGSNPNNRLCNFKGSKTVSRNLKNLFDRNGLENVTVHNLRHTFVTYAHKVKKVPYGDIGEYIGDNATTVEKTYTHINGDSRKALREVAEML